MRFKKSFLFICLVICLFGIASVSASDVNGTIVAVNEQIDVVTVNDDSVELEKGDADNLVASSKTFTDLANLINNGGSQINLESDYSYDYDEWEEKGVDSAYMGGIDLNKPVTINGNGHTIAGKNIFKVSADNVVLKNINFRIDNSYESRVIGVSISDVSNVNIIDCTVNDSSGQAFYIRDSSNVVLSNIKFYNYEINDDVRIVSIGGGQNNKLHDCEFINCDSQWGVFLAVSSDNFNMSDCDVINCSGDGENYIITLGSWYYDEDSDKDVYCSGGYLNNCIFENIGTNVISADCSDFKIVDCSFNNVEGTSIRYSGNDGLISDCNFENNYEEYEGCIFFNGLKAVITNCSFVNCSSSSDGGAIYSRGADVVVSNNKFINTSALGKGGAIYSIGKNMVIDNNSFTGTVAPLASSVFITGGIINNTFFTSENDIFVLKGAKIIKKSPTLTLNDINYTFNNLEDYSVSLKNGNDPFTDKKIILELFQDDFHINYDLTTSEKGIVNLLPLLKNLDVGIWNVRASYKGDANYEAVSKSAKIIISPIAPVLILDDVSTSINEETIISAVVNRQDNVVVNEGCVEFYAGDMLIGSSNVVNNIAKITYCPSSSGNYILKAIFKDSNYNIVQANSKIIVNAGKTEVSQEISYDNNQFSYNLPADATGLVTITVTSSVYTTTADGKVSADLSKLATGEYQYVLSYSGDDKYASFTKTGNLNVVGKSTQLLATTIQVEPVSTFYNEGDALVVTLKDDEGNLISNVPLTVDIKGLSTIMTDINGQIKVSTNGLAPGSYQAAITFYGTQKYEKSTKSVDVNVKKATPKLTAVKKTYSAKIKTKSYVVTLKTNQNKALKNAKVTLKVSGKTYSATTNSNGKATIKITKLTKKGTFSAVVTYAGNAYYNKLTKTVKITCK